MYLYAYHTQRYGICIEFALNCTEYGASKLHRIWCTESRLLNNETQVPLFLSTQNSLQHSTANTWVAMGGVFAMCVESCQPTSKVPFPQHRESPVQQLHPPRLEVRSLLRSQPCGKLAVCIRVYQSVSQCITESQNALRVGIEAAKWWPPPILASWKIPLKRKSLLAQQLLKKTTQQRYCKEGTVSQERTNNRIN